MLARFIVWAIQNSRFSKEDRLLFTGELLKRLGAIDPCGIVHVDEGKILIRGVPLKQEAMIRLRESAKAELDSFARSVVRDIVLNESYQIGFVTGKDFEQILFSRAAYWFGTRETELYKSLAADAGNSLLS